MAALPPKADATVACQRGSFGPRADVPTSHNRRSYFEYHREMANPVGAVKATSRTFPVFNVSAGSKHKMQASSSAQV